MSSLAQRSVARQFVTRLLSILVLFGALANAASALGRPELIPTCIQDAKRDYRKINSPAYVKVLQGMIDKLGDNRKVVFVECSNVEGVFAFLNASDPLFPKHSYIVYDPNYIRVVTQGDSTKLLFLLAREYGHFSLGHFNKQSELSIYQKELDADQQGGCAVARSKGDLSSLIQILEGLRDPTSQSGDPGLEDSKAAVLKGYEQCVTEIVVKTPPVEPRSKVVLVRPADVTTDSMGRSIDGLASATWDNNLSNVRNLKVQIADGPTLPEQVSAANLAELWKVDQSPLLVLSDRSAVLAADPDHTGDVSGPTFSGLFYVGPFAPARGDAVLHLGTAAGFAAGVSDPARLNLLLIEKISAVALGYAGLKYAMETGQPQEVILRFASLTDFALRDLRKHGKDIEDFSTWTTSLSRVDDLLGSIGS